MTGGPGPLDPLRRHLVAVVAVATALAVGLVVGGLVLGSGERVVTRSASTTDRPGVDALRQAEAGALAGQRFATAVAPQLYGGAMAGHPVVVIGLPGARGATVKAIVAQVVAAGGEATRTVAVRRPLLDPADRDQVDRVGTSLATSLAAQVPNPPLDPSAPTYERVGQLLARALATTQLGTFRADAVSTTIRDQLTAAGLIEVPNGVRQAALVLVVLPPGRGEPQAVAGRTLADLVTGLGSGSGGVVVVGDAASASDGDLARLRAAGAGDHASTVDGVDQPVGRVTSVLALEAAARGVFGSFGASGRDGSVPTG